MSRWGRDQLAQNRVAVRTMTNKYANALKWPRKTFNISRTGEAANSHVEVFWVVHDFTSSGHSGPCFEFTSDQFAVLEQKLRPFGPTLTPTAA